MAMPAPPPIIGFTAIPRNVHAGFGPYWGQTLADTFIHAIEEAGGVPVILPSTQPELAVRQVAGLDGLVLSGGADVHPSRYGAEVRPEMSWLDEHRDAWELAVLDAAGERHLPILGICRGAQLLNVWRGGRLVTHLETDVNHEGGIDARHPVEVGAGTLLDEVLGVRTIAVTTLHHQGVAELGAGLAVSARASDGLPEAVEDRSCNVLGVAWHPEFQLDEPAGQPLFRWIVEAARHAA
jgi:putative glutamine amidotransferase